MMRQGNDQRMLGRGVNKETSIAGIFTPSRSCNTAALGAKSIYYLPFVGSQPKEERYVKRSK